MKPDAALWLGGIALLVGLAVLVLSRDFEVTKLSLWKLQFTFSRPFQWTGVRQLLAPGAVVILAGLGLSLYGGTKKAFPETWPERFKNVNTAEIQISNIDDLMIVRVNGLEALRAEYGDTPAWVSVKELLQQGPNSIEVVIQNGQYGGCGGRLQVRLNGLTKPEYLWEWKLQANQLPHIVCFQEVKTLDLE